MTILKQVDFEVPGFREFASPPTAVPAYADAINALEPLAYWRLGEASGTTLADQGGTHPLTLSGSYTLGTSGALGTDMDDAVLFDGGLAESASAVFPGGSSAAFSVVFWLRVPGSISQNGSIISQHETVDTGHLRFILLSNGQLRHIVVGDTSVQTSGTVTTGWRMFVYSRSTGGTGRWYIDGLLDTEATDQTTAVYQTVVRIGTINGSGPDVVLDEVAIFDDEISADQTRWLYGLGTGRLTLPPGS